MTTILPTCEHVASGVKMPAKNAAVHKEECTKCFESDVRENVLAPCLSNTALDAAFGCWCQCLPELFQRWVCRKS